MKFFGRYREWLDLPELNRDADTVWFAFPMVVRERAPFTRREVQIFLENRNIQTRVVFTGNITRQPGFCGIAMRKNPAGYPNADRVMRQGFLIAAHHGMTNEMLAHVHESFEAFARQF
jgi:CDP-6-deoxy-D-xylo-4-hexulose-3-dehydrase